MRKGGSIMTNKELQFALEKALEVAKEKDREIKKLKAENQRLLNCMAFESAANTIDSESDFFLRREVETDSKDVLIITDHPLKHTMDVIPNVPIEDMAIHPNYSEPDHTSARMTISAIIGIAAGFILALILL
jgi:hypothetical protein